MPEGPELYKAAQFLNKVGSDFIFSKIRLLKPPSDKHPSISWTKPLFSLSAESRGKEIRISISETDVKNEKKCNPTNLETLNILLTFGMAGRFAFTKTSDIQKHSLLMFDTTNNHTFSFVDTRHFGRWSVTNDWSLANKRGPSIISEYNAFRSHVIASLDKSAFNKPICEVMLDQRYFSSVGNYLRAEILYRLNIDPYLKARTVLETLPEECDSKEPDIIRLCHDVCWEVISLKGSGKPYDPDQIYGDNGVFEQWLQCYMKPGMGNTIDDKGRTMWHRTTYGKGKISRHGKQGKVKQEKVKQEKKDASLVSEAKPQSKRRKMAKQMKSEPTSTDEKLIENIGSEQGTVKLEPLDMDMLAQTEGKYFRRRSARLRAVEDNGKEDKLNVNHTAKKMKSPYFKNK